MRNALLAIALFVSAISAVAQQTDGCPLRIEVTHSGDFYTNRFGGHFKTSPKLLESDLKAGCYNDNNPIKRTSVTVQIRPGAPAKSIANLYQILGRNGWPKSKVKVQP